MKCLFGHKWIELERRGVGGSHKLVWKSNRICSSCDKLDTSLTDHLETLARGKKLLEMRKKA